MQRRIRIPRLSDEILMLVVFPILRIADVTLGVGLVYEVRLPASVISGAVAARSA